MLEVQISDVFHYLSTKLTLKMLSDTCTPETLVTLASPSNSHYILPADDSEILRLNMQSQFLTREVSDGKLVYAPVVLQHGDKVLESGTGTGIWLLSLAAEVPPTISFTGIDIQTRLFPREIPSNASFFHHSITNLPAEWTAHFKLVNQRLLIGGLTSKEWEKALQEIYRVLTPGGWFQCIEPCIPSETDFGPHTNRMLELLQNLLSKNGLLHNISSVLSNILPHAGFINVQKRTVSLSAHERAMEFNHRTLMEWFFIALKPGMLATKLLESEEEFAELLQGMLQEWDETPHVAWSWSMIIAQKGAGAHTEDL